MEMTRYVHADAVGVRGLVLDVHDEAYAGDPDPFHSRERFAYFVDLWSGREDWSCVLGWEDGDAVGYAYGSLFKPGGWWKGHRRPGELRGAVFALSEFMVVPRWRGTGRARLIHDELVASVSADLVTLLVETGRPGVRALYERWGYRAVGEAKPYEDSPVYAVMVRGL
ncbi:GNAT family N-acetyltransferase [Streptomyces sp. NPDC087294]|uniref:GNAT family N-acetyltransferase n=1 Tax=Streptomyces sp. NPDC087294 TaxID=3365777 RepID=UPI00380B16DE